MELGVNKDNLFNKTISRISIDVDEYTEVPKVLYKAVNLFGKENVKVYVTSSGIGFRICINGKFSPLENIFYRALLGDDPYRLRYALRRYLATGSPFVLDIAFEYKASYKRYFGRVREVPLEEIYDEDINKCLEKVKKVLGGLYYYEVVVEKEENLPEKLTNIICKYKVIQDPYHDDRVIVTFVARDDSILEELKKHVKVIKVLKTKAHSKY